MSHKYEYEDVRKLILYQARRFQLRYGGEFDEIVAQSLLIFIKSSMKFKFRRGNKFSSYIANQVWRGLIDYYKRTWRYPQPLLEDVLTQRIIEIPTYSDRSVRFKVELLDSVGRDARRVVQHILEPDHKLQKILSRKKGGRIERRALRQYLTTERSWNQERVDNAFWDLQTALRT